MQVNFNTTKSQPGFGMAIKAEPIEKTKVREYLSRKLISNIKDTVELNKLIESQRLNPADIYLSTTAKSRDKAEKLRAIVGGREFISSNPLKAIKKAVREANHIYAEKLSFDARSEGTQKIISKIISFTE